MPRIEAAVAVADRQQPTGGKAAACAGALSLLRDCVGGRPGERLLIVEEPSGAGYYDEAAPRIAAAAARGQGLRVYHTVAPPGVSGAEEMSSFLEGLRGFDHVVFFARVGDQLRFADVSRLPPATMCYALDGVMLNSAFGGACHAGLCAVKAAIDAAFAAAQTVRVTCPRGTDYAGRLPPATMCYALDGVKLNSAFGGACHAGLCAVKAAIDAAFAAAQTVRVTCPRGTDYAGRLPQAAPPPGNVGVKRFPMLVPGPVPAGAFRGRVVLSRFLTGTGSRFYQPYWLPLARDVVAVVEGNCIADLEGDAETVARVRAHYADIAGRFGIDPWYLHSWHAGIHPACAYPGRAQDHMERWSGSAFGNPRILHFHTCGDYAPGEISWTLVDPTVALDGIAIWEAGRLHPERLPGGEALMAAHPNLAALYAAPSSDIGIEE